MTNTRTDPGDTNYYEIRINGRLDDRWSSWFEGQALTSLPDGTTVIDCPSIDQAALHGLLRQVRDAGLRLISVTRLDPEEEPAMTSHARSTLAVELKPHPAGGPPVGGPPAWTPPLDASNAPRPVAAAIPDAMRAVVYDDFGSPDVLQLRDTAVPTPGPGEVLVRVRAAAVNPWDWHFMRGLPYIARLNGAGIRRPKHPVLGGDIAGEVVATGTGTARVAVGDRVHGFIEFGGFAEYATAPEAFLAAMPANLTFEQAAAVPLAAMTALQGLRDAGRIQRGDRVLVIGASGGVGTFAVQLAKRFGAQVTAVTSGRNAALVRAIGADRVIDYTREDVATGDGRFDVILQLAGTASASALRRLLAPGGRLVLSSGDSSNRFVGPMGRAIRGLLLGKVVGQQIALLTAKWNADDLSLVGGLLEAGEVVPVVDSTWSLTEVADAIRYVESGRARGKVLVSVARP